MQLIPTRYKAKIPQEYSHPIGTQEISEGLFGVPQYQKLEISFSSVRSGYYRNMIQKERKINIFKISYSPRAIYIPTWNITISPLPQSYKQNANEHLVNITLPKIKKWLFNLENIDKDEKRTDFYETKSIEVYLDLKSGQFEYKIIDF